MFEEIRHIFGTKIIDNVTDFSEKYYYFYKDINLDKVFGLSKEVSLAEYEMLKLLFIEKVIFTNYSPKQKIYDYLFNKGIYPFKERVKLIIYNIEKKDEIVVEELLKNLFKKFTAIPVLNYQMAFIEDNFDFDMKSLFSTISDDLGYLIRIHEGILINSQTDGLVVAQYLNIYHNSDLKTHDYSQTADLILDCHEDERKILLEICSDLFTFSLPTIELIKLFINNNLNVSATSKLAYMNRNTLLSKLDYISKMSGFNIQRFMDAAALYLIIMHKK